MKKKRSQESSEKKKSEGGAEKKSSEGEKFGGRLGRVLCSGQEDLVSWVPQERDLGTLGRYPRGGSPRSGYPREVP